MNKINNYFGASWVTLILVAILWPYAPSRPYLLGMLAMSFGMGLWHLSRASAAALSGADRCTGCPPVVEGGYLARAPFCEWCGKRRKPFEAEPTHGSVYANGVKLGDLAEPVDIEFVKRPLGQDIARRCFNCKMILPMGVTHYIPAIKGAEGLGAFTCGEKV
jgi:hypothetical protein